MDTRQDYYQTAPDFVKLKLQLDEDEKPVPLAKSEMFKMIVFLFLGLGCLAVTAVIYTQSKATSPEKDYSLVVEGRTNEEEPMQQEEAASGQLLLKPYHVIVITIQSPLSYFGLISASDEITTDWSSDSFITSTPIISTQTTSSDFTEAGIGNWLQWQFDSFKEQVKWMNENYVKDWVFS